MKNNDPDSGKGQLFFKSKSLVILKFTTENPPQILIACGVSEIPQLERIPNLWNRACDAITTICGICVSVVDNHLTQSIFKH